MKPKKLFSMCVIAIVAILAIIFFEAKEEEIYPGPPPAYELKIYAEGEDGQFKFAEILPTQNEGVFVYDIKNNKALVFSNIVFTEDMREVRFTLSGDEIEGERHYFLTLDRDASNAFANVLAGGFKIHIAIEGMAQIQ